MAEFNDVFCSFFCGFPFFKSKRKTVSAFRFVMGFVEQLAVYIPGDNLTEVRLKDFDDTDNQTKECLLRFHFLLPRA